MKKALFPVPDDGVEHYKCGQDSKKSWVTGGKSFIMEKEEMTMDSVMEKVEAEISHGSETLKHHGKDKKKKRKSKKQKRKAKTKKHKKKKKARQLMGDGGALSDSSSSLRSFGSLEENVPSQHLQDFSANDSWTFDVRGDKANLELESLYRLDVPIYSRPRKRPRNKRRQDAPRAAFRTRYFGSTSQEVLSDTKTVLLRLARSERRQDRMSHPVAMLPEVIPVPPDVDELIEASSDSESEPVAQRSTELESVEQYLQRRTKEFNTKTREHPKDIVLWLRFVKFQEEYGKLTKLKLTVPPKAILEKQLAILDAALKENPGNKVLWMNKLNIMQSSGLEFEVLEDLWLQALASCNNAVELWQAYLKHSISGVSFSSLSMAAIREQYAKALELLRKKSLNKCQVESDLLSILYDLWWAEKAAGHEERAIAIIQGLFEINLCCPKDSDDGEHNYLTALEQFWEGESVRIGEGHPDVAGWSRISMAEAVPPAEPPEAAIPSQSKSIQRVTKKHKRKKAADFFGESIGANLGPSLRALKPRPREKRKYGFHKAYEQALAAVELEKEEVRATAAGIDVLLMGVEKKHKSDAEQETKDEMTKAEGNENHEVQASPNHVQPLSDNEAEPNEQLPQEVLDAEGIGSYAEDGTVYSAVHGYRIKVTEGLQSSSALEYQRMLADLREETGGAPRISKKKLEAQRREAEDRGEEQTVEEDDIFVRWLGLESELSRTQWAPIRVTEQPQIAEEFPDRVIFFEDIRPYLFRFEEEHSLLELLHKACYFMGLKFHRAIPRQSSVVLGTYEWSGNIEDNPLITNMLEAQRSSNEDDDMLSPQPLVNHPLTVLAEADAFVTVSYKLRTEPSRQHFVRNLLYAILQSEVPVAKASRVPMQCALIGLEGEVKSHAAGTTIARSLLQGNEDGAADLRLWAAYAALEQRHGNTAESRRVCSKALSLVPHLPPTKQLGAPLLYWTYARCLLGLPLSPLSPVPLDCQSSTPKEIIPESVRNEAVHSLACMAEGSFISTKKKNLEKHKMTLRGLVSPVRLMRARQRFEGKVSEELGSLGQASRKAKQIGPFMTSLDPTPNAFYYVVGYAWLQLITQGPEEARQVFVQAINTMTALHWRHFGSFYSAPEDTTSKSQHALFGNRIYRWDRVLESCSPLAICLERLHRAWIEMMLVQSRACPGPMRYLREPIQSGLQCAPCDTSLLYALLYSEKHSRACQHVRHHLGEVAKRDFWRRGYSGLEWVFFMSETLQRIQREKDRLSTLPSSSLSLIRNTFERILESPTGAQLAVIWRIYLRVEAWRGFRGRAKRIFYRAVHACPLNKDLWLDMVRPSLLRKVFTVEELNDMMDIATERGIYLRAEAVYA